MTLDESEVQDKVAGHAFTDEKKQLAELLVGESAGTLLDEKKPRLARQPNYAPYRRSCFPLHSRRDGDSGPRHDAVDQLVRFCLRTADIEARHAPAPSRLSGGPADVPPRPVLAKPGQCETAIFDRPHGREIPGVEAAAAHQALQPLQLTTSTFIRNVPRSQRSQSSGPLHQSSPDDN